MSIEHIRERIRQLDQEKVQRRLRKVWQPPILSDFAVGAVLAFDQTLTKCGWVIVEFNGESLMIHEGGVLKPHSDLKGFEQTYDKADILGGMLAEIYMDSLGVVGPWPIEAVVHEMPSVMGYRTESSLMAGREVRRVFADQSIVMMSRQHAYATIVGDPHAEKSKGTAAVNALVPNWCRNTSSWSQDVHDAVLLGATYLYDKKKAA